MTRLSWNEIRVRAATFAEEWRDAAYERSETQSFYNEFFEVFGVRRRTVARYEEHVKKRLDDSSGYIDLFWPGVLIVEQKSAGRDLGRAYDQAGDYFDALPERDRPRYILVSDFQTFELHDRDERKTITFALVNLHQHVKEFSFISDVERRPFRGQDPVNIEASELVGKLYDALDVTGYRGHDLERFLVRIVFCLFADDTGIFDPRDIFFDLIEQRTGDDGSDLGQWLTHLFQVLDTPQDERPTALDEDLARFPYINGDLFKGQLSIPSFDASMRKTLLTTCQFDWSGISPAIFGALFQSVMNSKARRALGAHYTTEKNILKVIEPLFMDDLWDEFERLKSRRDSRRRADLRRFQEKLGQLRFLDPACGCGNFLIITYRELRLLEIEVIREIRTASDTADQREIFGARTFSQVDVDQFYGIEIGEFPVRVAETALWMMDHLMNDKLSLEFGRTYARIPLQTAPHIIHGDALETDWAEMLPPSDCSFVLGNPPFAGAKFQTEKQRAQVHRIAALGKTGGTLDYVTAWFLKVGAYIVGPTRIGFVATNSTTQGEQVGQLWPLLFDRYRLEIAFAHRTFAWGSNARGKAHVHVVILGLDRQDNARTEKRLFSYSDLDGDPEETRHTALSPYLFDASGLADPHLTVSEESRPINRMQKLITGSKPIDDGHYIFDSEEREFLLSVEPGAMPFFRPFVGAREYLNGGTRWILALHDAPPATLAQLPCIKERIAAVRAYRQASKSKPTQRLAETPTLYHVNVLPTAPFLVIPQVSSERREYIPIGWLEPPVIPSDKLRLRLNATLADFALLTSAMHMAWMRTVTGRMKSDYMYSVGVVYNTFPTPPEGVDLSKLEPLAQAVLDARAAHPGATLASLYDPDLMPPNLRKAHTILDRAIDRFYRRGGFASERERVEHLFGLYERMRAPLQSRIKTRRKRGKIHKLRRATATRKSRNP